jgi:non-specific serine/threonine protein kinase/serine/threonine-protein kinase
VLYALLTGKAPFGGDSVIETLDAVRTKPAEPRSRLNANVPRDLEIICLKALEKEPSRRYASARDLALDLRRWLSGEPIAARPVGGLTRAWMWCRRSPVLAGTAAALVLALLGGLAGTTSKWRDAITASDKAERRREQAEQEAAKARAVVEFLADDILAQAAPEKNPRNKGVTIEDALDLAAPAIAARFARQPEVEVPIRMMVGRTYRQLGKLDKAEPHLRTVLELSRRSLGVQDGRTLQATDDLATLLQEQGKLAEAERLFRWTLEGRIKTEASESNATLTAMNNLAYLLQARRKLVEAESLLRQVKELRTSRFGPEDPLTLVAAENLCIVLKRQGKLAEVEPQLRTLLEVRTRVLGADHQDTLTTLSHLGDVLRRLEKLDEAEPILRRLVEVRTRVNGPDHPWTFVEMNNLALCLRGRAKLDEAEVVIQTCLTARRRILGVEHPHTLTAMRILGSTLQDRGRLAEAERLFREVYEIGRRTQGDEDPDRSSAANNLAFVLALSGKLDEADRLFRQALEIQERQLGPNNPMTLGTMKNLAVVLGDRGDVTGAERFSRQALEGDRRVLGPNHSQSIRAMEARASILLELGQIAQAEELAREALARRAGGPHRATASARYLLGACLAARGRDADAEPLLVTGYEDLATKPDAPRLHVRQALGRIIAFYESRAQPARAQSWRARRLDVGFPADAFAHLRGRETPNPVLRLKAARPDSGSATSNANRLPATRYVKISSSLVDA